MISSLIIVILTCHKAPVGVSKSPVKAKSTDTIAYLWTFVNHYLLKYLESGDHDKSGFHPAALVIQEGDKSYRCPVIVIGNRNAGALALGMYYLSVTDIDGNMVDGTVLGVENKVSAL